MGTELYGACVKDADVEIPSIPPGFESFPSFTLKRVEDSKSMISCSTSASESQSVPHETEPDISDAAKLTRSLRRRTLINYGRLGDSCEDGPDIQQNLSVRPGLPKGVIRGCPECSNCQKVIARWRPEDACRPNLEDAPVFYPNEEEFEDTLTYIERIRPIAEPYGICRIVAPPSWKPPCPLKEKSRYEGSKFATRVQKIDKLQNRNSMRKMLKNNNSTRRKRRRCSRMGVECGTGDPSEAALYEAETFGFEPGPELTMATFEKYADDFKAQYFSKNENIAEVVGNITIARENWEPSVEFIEGEYWRMVEKPTEEIEVLYGADLETGSFGSGFPKMSSQVGSASDEKYIKSGWNLNNFPRLQGSVLSYESSDISGVLVPWLYIGMCFSSFCWHVEDHHLYSLNYMHWGASKIWYGVPENDAVKLEVAMRKYLPDLFEEQPDLLHKLVTQLSPSILKSEGIPVYRCVQNPREFVLTFPRAYHSGFNCGFNCAEAVNVAPVDWLPHGQNAIELYREQGRKTSISHDKLLLGAAREAVKAHWELNLLKNNTPANLRWKTVCGKDGILARALKTRVEMEHTRREFFCNSMQAVKMEGSFDATSERECSVCSFDLHLSAAGCYRCQDRYACLNHAKQFCSCASNAKFFLFRYDINELNILVEALEGKLSAVYRWARLDLGLALSSYVSRGKLQSPGFAGKLSHASEETILKEVKSRSSIKLEDQKGKEITKEVPVTPTGYICGTSSVQLQKPSEALASSKVVEAASSLHRSLNAIKMESNNSQFKKEEVGTSIGQFTQEQTSYRGNLVVKEEPGEKKSFGFGFDNVILLSDDEGDEPKKPVSCKAEEPACAKHLEPSERTKISYDKVSPCNSTKAPVLTAPVNDASVISQVDISSLHAAESRNRSFPVCVKDEYHGKDVLLGSNPANLPCQVGSKSVEFSKHLHNLSATKEASGHKMANTGSALQHPQPCDGAKPCSDDKNENMGTTANSNIGNSVITITGNQLCTQNNLDRYYRQKGPRIAKVVRRINCNVEPLEFGVMLSGKLWCNSQAIFPKGFRSRVRYINVSDPTNMSYYVSEILDAGREGPLFMVSLEHCPNEVFIHLSVTRCWEMVRERVNQEITKLHKLGRTNLPPLQPPGGLDGFEMFGFSSPAIVQAIEAMDKSRVCTEYWDSRPYSRPQIQIPQSRDNKVSIQKTSDRPNDQGNHKLPVEVHTMLGGLLKKANPEELQSLYSILSNNRPTSDQDLLSLVNEEIQTRPRLR